jgi:acetoin utilization protein AcuB
MSLPPSLIRAMTPFPFSVSSTAPVSEAIALMNAHDVHHLPVIDGDAVVGLLTWAEVTAATGRSQSGDGPRVAECCTKDVYVVDLNEALDTVLLTMAERRTDCAVVTRHGHLAGVFTAVDACRAFGEYLAENFPHGDGHDAA